MRSEPSGSTNSAMQLRLRPGTAPPSAASSISSGRMPTITGLSTKPASAGWACISDSGICRTSGPNVTT